MDYPIFELGDVCLQHGGTLPNAKLAYQTYGELNADKSNAIVYPTWYSGQHYDNESLIGQDRALDPSRYFIIVPDMFGNGLSSSPSNTPPPHDRDRFPHVTMHDNVRFQHQLVTEYFGIERLELVTGWSMGAGQTYQWAASHPDMVRRILPFCGAATTSVHNAVFLESIRAALTADAAWQGGRYSEQPVTGLCAMARVYAGWGFSQQFYREELYRQEPLGYGSLEDFLVGFWEGMFRKRDANNLLAMLWTWQHADLGNTPGYADRAEALAGIRARTVLMPAQQDLYFTPEDNERELTHLPGARMQTIPSAWGHFAGSGINPVDTQFIDDTLAELLNENTPLDHT